jgi:hypothetical protein
MGETKKYTFRLPDEIINMIDDLKAHEMAKDKTEAIVRGIEELHKKLTKKQDILSSLISLVISPYRTPENWDLFPPDTEIVVMDQDAKPIYKIFKTNPCQFRITREINGTLITVEINQTPLKSLP